MLLPYTNSLVLKPNITTRMYSSRMRATRFGAHHQGRGGVPYPSLVGRPSSRQAGRPPTPQRRDMDQLVRHEVT